MTMVWKARDLTEEAGVPLATLAAATCRFQRSLHVIYQRFTSTEGSDGNIHELYVDPDSDAGTHNDLTSATPATRPAPTGGESRVDLYTHVAPRRNPAESTCRLPQTCRMSGTALRIATAHADPADLRPGGNDWAVVSGVPCRHIALPHAWATTGRLLALPGPPEPGVVAAVSAWLRARSPEWSLLVRAGDEPAFGGFRRLELMPVLALDGQPRSRPGPPVDIGPARNCHEFLVPYGAHLAPSVTAAHLGSPRMHHLVARVDSEPVGCARIQLMADTAYVGAVTVLPAWRGRGLGTALTLAASQLAASLSTLVWLHCTEFSAPLYQRIGYQHVDNHALLVPDQAPWGLS
jgi:GNAT superfamily N-acetyltransferase